MHSPSSQRHSPFSPTIPTEFAMAFASTPRGARLARLFVAHCLDSWWHPYDGGVNETLALITAELCANAVRHGRVPGRDFHVRLAGQSDVEVAASSSSPPWPTTGASPTAVPAPARPCGPW